MNIVLRVVLAVIIGCIVTALLDHYSVLNSQINFLLGIAAALLVYFVPFNSERL